MSLTRTSRRKIDLLLSFVLIAGAFFPEIGALLIVLLPRITGRELVNQYWDLTLWIGFCFMYAPTTLGLLAAASGIIQGILWARWLALLAGLGLLFAAINLRANPGFGFPLLTIAAACFLLFMNGWSIQKTDEETEVEESERSDN